MEKRVCKVCGISKPLTTANFDRSSRLSKRTGKRKWSFNHHTCKRCRYLRESRAMFLSETPEIYLRDKWNVLSRKRRGQGVEVCGSLKGRAGVKYLMELWSAQRGLCAVTGIPMAWGRVLQGDIKRDGLGTAVGIDRIDNEVGYVRGNLQLVCAQVNFMRSGLSEEAFLEWCEAVVRGQEPPFC